VITIIINVLKYLKSVSQLSDDRNIYVSWYVGREPNGVIYPQILVLLVLKIEVIRFSETLLTIHQSTRPKVP
jgi:hypothetical protein